MSRVWAITAGTLAMGINLYAVAGVLPLMAGNLGVSAGAIGLLVSVYALTFAIAAPTITSVIGHLEPRRTLIIALVAFASVNILIAVAPTYSSIGVLRILAALAAAAFLPLGASTAARLAPPNARGRALAFVSAGYSVANIIGLPIATNLGTRLGWRSCFILIGGVAIIASAAIRAVVPSLPPEGPVPTVAEIVAPLRNRRVLQIVGITITWAVGSFSVYTYVAPLIATVAHVPPDAFWTVVLFYGLGATIGNLAGGALSDHIPPLRVACCALFAMAVTLALLPLVARTQFSASLILVAWGTASLAASPAYQRGLLAAVSTQQGPFALALFYSAFNVGVAIGAALGGIIIRLRSVADVPTMGALLATIAFFAAAAIVASDLRREAAAA